MTVTGLLLLLLLLLNGCAETQMGKQGQTAGLGVILLAYIRKFAF